MSRDLKNQLLIFLTLFIALYIDSYLFLSTIQTIKPAFVLLTLIYWNIALPDRIGIMAALSFGIFVDLIEMLKEIKPLLPVCYMTKNLAVTFILINSSRKIYHQIQGT